MIEWRPYVGRQFEQGREPRKRGWLGWINGRPVYVITPDDDLGVRTLRSIPDSQDMTTASGQNAIGDLQKAAEDHHAKLVGD